jgi:hypothetical protein
MQHIWDSPEHNTCCVRRTLYRWLQLDNPRPFAEQNMNLGIYTLCKLPRVWCNIQFTLYGVTSGIRRWNLIETADDDGLQTLMLIADVCEGWAMSFSGAWRRVALVRTDVSEERITSIIRVTTVGELRTTVTVTSGRSHPDDGGDIFSDSSVFTRATRC